MRTVGVMVVTCLAMLGCVSPGEASQARAAWTRACVRLSGCAPFSGLQRPYAECAELLLRRADARPAECVVEARTCAEALECVGVQSPEGCPEWSYCTGDVLHHCQNGVRLPSTPGGFTNVSTRRDCAAEGLVCRTIYPTFASEDFHYGVCALPGTCDADSCDGDLRVRCNVADVHAPGVPVPVPCAQGRCRGATCVGDGPACETGLWCDGDDAVTCLGGFVHRERCAPGTCSPERSGSYAEDGSERCIGRDECRPHCEGTSLVRCVEGSVERYDCREWGFDNCVQTRTYQVLCR